MTQSLYGELDPAHSLCVLRLLSHFTVWVGLANVGSCLPGKRKHRLALRNVPSHWRPGGSCDKSLRQRRQDGTRGRDEYENVLSICRVAETQLGECQEEGRPGAAQAPSSSQIP